MVYSIRAVLLLIILCGLLIGCGKPLEESRADATDTTILQRVASTITTRGIIQRREVTSYQYGTHIVLSTSGRTLYALTTDDGSLLNRHVGKSVLVTGTLRAGYPLDGGPALLVVAAIQRDEP